MNYLTAPGALESWNQVWTNIIDNAIDAMDGAGRIVLRTRRDGKQVVVEIEDDGPDSTKPRASTERGVHHVTGPVRRIEA